MTSHRNALDLYYLALARVVPRSPLVRSKVLNELLHKLPYTRIRKPRLGLFRADDLLGWAHRPEVRVVHPSFEFRARYAIDSAGRRVTGCTDHSARILVLGCSWAFGHGVHDEDALGGRLAQVQRIATLNYACMGYGPAQGYLQLLHRIPLAEVAVPDCAVLYVWVPDQLMRSWRGLEWVRLNAWVNPDGPSHPVFDLDGDGLRHAGLIGVDEAVTDQPLLPGVVERTEWQVCARLFRSMAELVTRAGRRFLVVVPPLPARDRPSGRKMTRLLAAEGVPCLDLDAALGLTDGARARLFYRFDGHPTPVWHAVVAEAIATATTPHPIRTPPDLGPA